MEVKVLDFTGKWCSTCIILDEILESEIIPKYKNRVKFIKIDVEENEKLTKQYEILSVPTLILLKDSKKIWRKSGSIFKDEIIKELEKTIK
ncbi:MAG: thioredoxin family protein [Candidatus Diapherotrites archaeon]